MYEYPALYKFNEFQNNQLFYIIVIRVSAWIKPFEKTNSSVFWMTF